MSPRSSSRTPNKNADWDSACYKCVSRERVGNSTIINIPLRVRVMVVFVTAAAGKRRLPKQSRMKLPVDGHGPCHFPASAERQSIWRGVCALPTWRPVLIIQCITTPLKKLIIYTCKGRPLLLHFT
ncbi:hypothetical protein PS2_006671 [Malus domestica]